MTARLSDDQQNALLSAMQPMSVDAGEIIIREGEIGDRFYIIAEVCQRIGHPIHNVTIDCRVL